jgi:hypothetical protein
LKTGSAVFAGVAEKYLAAEKRGVVVATAAV